MSRRPTYEELEQRVKDLEHGSMAFQEINERRKASSKEWRTIFDAISDSVSMIDLEGTITRCNKAMTDLLQKPFDKVIGASCWELVHGTSEPIEGCPIVRMRETRQRESMILQIDGVFFNVVADPIFDKAGHIIGAVHIFSDINKFKKTEEALRKSEERLSLAVKAADLFLWEWRVDLGEVYADEKSLEVISLTREKARNFSLELWLSKIHPEDRDQTQEKILAHFQGETMRVEQEIRVGSQERGWTWLYGIGKVVERDSNGKPIRMVGIHQDINERKCAEEERERLINALEKALDNIKKLKGLLPICARCKKIRDDKGYWNQIEAYIERYSDASFSHSLCPECLDKLYGDKDWYKNK